MREEEEERLRSENLSVEIILLNDNDDCLARMEQIKVDMRPKINHLFKCNLEENQRKNNLIDFAKCAYNSMKTYMKTHSTLNYTLNDNNVSSDYIGSIYDDVIEESVLKYNLALFLGIRKESMR